MGAPLQSLRGGTHKGGQGRGPPSYAPGDNELQYCLWEGGLVLVKIFPLKCTLHMHALCFNFLMKIDIKCILKSFHFYINCAFLSIQGLMRKGG